MNFTSFNFNVTTQKSEVTSLTSIIFLQDTVACSQWPETQIKLESCGGRKQWIEVTSRRLSHKILSS